MGNTFTVEAWIRPANVTSGRRIIFSTRDTGNTGGFDLEVQVSGADHYLSVNTPGIFNGGIQNPFVVNQWYHVAYVKEAAAGPHYFYIDGVRRTNIVSENIRTISNTSSSKWIGRDIPASGFFQGHMDQVRVWNVARKQEELQRDMFRELTGNENSLVAYYKFDENSGCTVRDEAGYNDQGTLSPTCSSTDSPSWSTTIPTLNNDRPDLPPGTVTNSRGGWLYSGRAVANTDLTVRRVEYAVNGGSFLWATPTDGVFNANGENFEVLFQSNDNGNTKPGYILDLKATDNTDKTGTRTHFDPFNLSSVRKVDNNQLEFVFNVNKQRTLMKDQLDRYKILYSSDGSGDKTLLDDIPIDFEAVRSRLQNQAENSPACDPCIYDNHKMKVSYQDNNSQITVTTKKASTLTGLTTFKITAINPDKFEQTSNSLTLEPDNNQVKAATDQLTSAPEEETTSQGLNPKEGSTLKFPGQKTTFETPSGAQTGPIAQIINGVITTVLGIWEKIGTILNFKL